MTEVPSSGRQGPGQERYDDEISLVDLAITLVRRKWWAIGVFVLVLAAALAYITLQPDRQYTGQIELQLIHVPESLQAEPPPDIAGILKNEFGSGDPVLNSAKLEQGILALEVQGKDRDEVKSLLESIMSKAQELAEKELLPWATASLNDFQDRMKDYQDRIAGYERRVQLLEEKSLQEKESDSLAALIQAELALRQHLDQKREQFKKLEKSASQSIVGKIDNGLKPSRLIKEPAITSEGASANLILALSVVLGLMAGIFAAFFAEFAASVRRRMQER